MNLFIDDERDPPNDGREWVVCRSWQAVISKIITRGMPSFISFDHDLGENSPTGYDIAKGIVELCLDGEYELPDDFDYYVHSQNPVGKANIEGYLNGYLSAVQRSKEVPASADRFNELYNIMLSDDDSGSILVGKNG